MTGGELEPGDLFEGRYRIERRLGEGERKQTYLAHDIRMRRDVAISLVKPEAIAVDPDGTQRETEILGLVGRHEDIVSQYDVVHSSDGSPEFMVFEYLPGGTLAEHVGRHGPLPLVEILRFGRQVCNGLAHLHQRGLIHRDLSSANIWLDDHQRAHIGDFDSAVPVDERTDERPSATNPFASPEERLGSGISERSDLYSLGGVLFELATGERSLSNVRDLRKLRPDVPTALADLVSELLMASPDDRPPTAEIVLKRLDSIDRLSDLPAMLAAGESEEMEWKSSVHHRHGPLPRDLEEQVANGKKQPIQAEREVRRRLNIEVTKTVAAFLNSGGGTLLVGVNDQGAVVGIERDYEHCHKGKQDADGWQLSLKDLLTNSLGGDIWSSVNVSLVDHENGTVGVIRCGRRQKGQTWHESTEPRGEVFYVRAGSATEELTGRRLVEYIRERWPHE